MRNQVTFALIGSLVIQQSICVSLAESAEPNKTNGNNPKTILINKIMDASQAATLPDRIVDNMLEKCQQGSTAGVVNLPFTKDMPTEKQQEMQARITKGKKVFVEQVQKYRGVLELPQFLPKILSGLFDKYYNAQDLQVILKFWQSPTGQKTARLLPQIQGDYVKTAFEYLLPKFIEIFKDIMQNPEVQERLNSLRSHRMQRMEKIETNSTSSTFKTFKIESAPSTTPANPSAKPYDDSSKSSEIKELLNYWTSDNVSQDRFNFQPSIFKSRLYALIQLLTLMELGGCCQLLGYLCL